MKCSNCGTENMDSMAFCTVCGTTLAADNPVSPPAPVQDVAPAANPAQVSAPTAVADPVAPAYNAPQTMAPGPMQGPPMGPGPMQGPPMGPGPMQGPPMGPGPMQGPPMMPPPPPILECGQCKKPFGPDEPFCTNCGAPRQMAIVRPVSAPGAKKSTKTMIIVAIAIVVLIGVAFGIYALIRESNYNNAIAQMDMGNYEVAYEEFQKLGNYESSIYYANECYLYIRYYEAVDLMDNGQYIEAKEIFDELGEFMDSSFLSEDCLNYIDYNTAMDLYNEGKYYEAYKIFDDLGYFEDSWEWADKCVQTTPASGVVEKGPVYVQGSAIFLIQNNSILYNICVMVYTEDGDYWGMIFVEWSDMATVTIEPGVYYIGSLVYCFYSYSKWFGPEDMFGDDGTEVGPVNVGEDKYFEITSSGYGLTWGSGY